MALSQPAPNQNYVLHQHFNQLKLALETDNTNAQLFTVWSARMTNFMDGIQRFNGRIIRSNICDVLRQCRGYGNWSGTNIVLRYYANASVNDWSIDVKRRLIAAQASRIAASRHADAHRVARAAARGRGHMLSQGRIINNGAGIMAIGGRARRGRGRRRRRGRGGRGDRGGSARQRKGTQCICIRILPINHRIYNVNTQSLEMR